MVSFGVTKKVEITDSIYERYSNLLTADASKLALLLSRGDSALGIPPTDDSTFEDDDGTLTFDPSFDLAVCMSLQEVEETADKIRKRAAELRHLLENRPKPIPTNGGVAPAAEEK